MTQNVIEYQTSYTSVPNITVGPIPVYSPVTQSTTTYTSFYTTKGYTKHYSLHIYGISPKATTLRTLTVTGLEQIEHYKLPNNIPIPTITPAPSVSPVAKTKQDLTGVLITYPYDESATSTTPTYQKYDEVHVNRGFSGSFLEVGIDYMFSTVNTSQTGILSLLA